MDIIAKLIKNEVIIFEEEEYHNLLFLSENGEILVSEYKGSIDHVNLNDVVKLRSISIIHYKNENRIEFNNYSNIM